MEYGQTKKSNFHFNLFTKFLKKIKKDLKLHRFG